jgi:O-methyltransferase involved in polyketide biosynthesis
MVCEVAISSSAFLVCELRSREEALGRDRYAKLWSSPAVRDLARDFDALVYPHDGRNLAIRNRFFLEQVELLAEQDGDPVLINLGAGFSNYAFLIDRPLRTIEVDLPDVISFKQARIAQLCRERSLPERAVTFLAADLNSTEERAKVSRELRAAAGGHPSLVVMEGLTYYLSSETFNALAALLRAVQSPGSRLALDYWSPREARNPTIGRFQRFLADRLGLEGKTYSYLEDERIANLAGYELQQLTDVAAQERHYTGSATLSELEVIFDRYAVLARSDDTEARAVRRQSLETLPASVKGWIPTLNKMGYMTERLSEPFSEEFAEFASRIGAPALDVGAAYGVATLEALKRGAHVIANDVEPRHLELLSRRVPEAWKARLTLAPGVFPEGLSFSASSLGAVASAPCVACSNGSQRGERCLSSPRRPTRGTSTSSGRFTSSEDERGTAGPVSSRISSITISREPTTCPSRCIRSIRKF